MQMKVLIASILLTYSLISCQTNKQLFKIDSETALYKISHCKAVDSLYWRNVELYEMTSWGFIDSLINNNIKTNGEWSLILENRNKIKGLKDLDSTTINIIKQDIARSHSCIGFVYCSDENGVKNTEFKEEFLDDNRLYYISLSKR